MVRMIATSEFSSSHEIVELKENSESESKIDGATGNEKFLKKQKIEDSINKLFEAMQISGIDSRREVLKPERRAMKRPMRVAAEPVSLKQALRGLCISHASEMAAMKKQKPRTSGISGVGIESKQSFVAALDVSYEVSESRRALFVRRELSSVHPVHELKVDDRVSIACQRREDHSTRIKSLKTGFGLSKQSLRTRNFVRKNRCQQNEAENDDISNTRTAYEKSKSSVQKGCEVFDKLPPASSSSASGEAENWPNRGSCQHHMSNDSRWEAISCVRKQHGSLGLRHFKFLRRLCGGETATVYLCELIDTNCLFAVKVTDIVSTRGRTENEILEILDHPFLPTLYARFTANELSYSVMEYCPGGDLLALQRTQPAKCFPENAARFYAAEILVALEYVHMLGIVYRGLKLRNILVRDDGHIVLSDFSSSVRCAVNRTVLKPSSPVIEPPKKTTSNPCSHSSCADPFCLQPLSCFTTTRKLKSELATQVIPLVESNCFAPDIIEGQDHDWWAYGIVLYELLYGETPFKGSSNEETEANVACRGFNFPRFPIVSSHARDLIGRLLNKEKESRLGSGKGAAEIKRHSFFEGLNWALIRHETPPELPKFDSDNLASLQGCRKASLL